MKFEYWQSDKDSNWYWRLKASNGETVAVGEGYANKADCLHAIHLVKGGATGAESRGAVTASGATLRSVWVAPPIAHGFTLRRRVS